MADTTALKNRIRAAIKSNGNQEITGPVLQQALLDMVDELDLYPELQEAINTEKNARQNADTQLNNLIAGIKNNIDNGYVYAGIATPSTTPVSGKVFYIVRGAGTYTHFKNADDKSIVLENDGIYVLTYKSVENNYWEYNLICAFDSELDADSINPVQNKAISKQIALLQLNEVNTLSPTIANSNAYINLQGRVIPGGGAFYTNPISLPSGRTVVAKAEGFKGNIAIIAKVITAGSSYQALVRSIDSQIRYYSYTNDTGSDIQVAISGLNAGGLEAYTVINKDLKNIVFPKLSQIDNTLAESEIKNTLSPTIADDNAYINPQGRVIPGGGAFYTNPISLPSGRTVVAKAEGFKGNVVIIAKVITAGSSYQVLVKSIDSQIRYYSYTNDTGSDIQVAISGLNAGGLEAYTVIKLSTVTRIMPSISFDNTIIYPLLNPIVETMDMLGIVKDWGFIGDSLNSGEIYYKRTSDNVTISRDMYAWSWGQNICQLCGTVGTNFSVGGLTPKSWINRYWNTTINGYRTGGGGETFNDNPKQVYTICLGTNDVNAMIRNGMDAEARAAYIGSWNDVDINDFNNNADTFYGNYCGIIQRIKSIQPSAKIFLINLFSIFHNSDIRLEINAAISDINSRFTNTFLVDLETLVPVSETIIEKYGRGHFRVQGYMWFSYVIGNIINRIIRDNVSAFDSLPFIGIEGKDDGTL